MQEVIEVLAYTQHPEICPECGGSGNISNSSLITRASIKDKSRLDRRSCECESCGGSGKREFMSMVVRRFEYCPFVDNDDFCQADHNPLLCKETDEDCKKEQTFKIGEKYKFALQTGKCEDCLRGCIGRFRNPKDEECFEPRIIKGVVREEGINFEKINTGTKVIQEMPFDNYKWIDSLKLEDGEYILLKILLI